MKGTTAFGLSIVPTDGREKVADFWKVERVAVKSLSCSMTISTARFVVLLPCFSAFMADTCRDSSEEGKDAQRLSYLSLQSTGHGSGSLKKVALSPMVV